MSDDEYPKCKYCGKQITFINRLPYEAVIPEHLQNTVEGSMWAFSGPHRHLCYEYFKAKEQEDRDAPCWSSIIKKAPVGRAGRGTNQSNS